MNDADGERQVDPESESFFKKLLQTAASQRSPELFTGDRPDALYQVRDRHGVSVVCLRTSALDASELRKIMTYRLAQYVALGYVNLRLVYETRMEHEPLHYVGSRDIHFAAGAASDGELLCYMVLKAPPEAVAGTTLRTRDRALFPIEEIFGWGVYNRLNILPDLPLERIGELERFAKNQLRPSLDELTARAPIELALGVLRTLIGPLAGEIDACLADVEEGVKAKKMWDFFHVPSSLIHGVIPFVARETYPFPSYQVQTRFPTAFLCADIPTRRLSEIERALEEAGNRGVAELLALKGVRFNRRSGLEPAGGLGPLTDAAVAQHGVPMEVRRERLDLGNWLRTTQTFGSLTIAEAAVLGTLFARVEAEGGEMIVRQGELGDDLFVIESGTAEVQLTDGAGHRVTVRRLGPGDSFGEIALMTAGVRTADVIALEPMTLLRLGKDEYVRYLSRTPEVERELLALALERSVGLPSSRPALGGGDLRDLFRDVLPADAVVHDPAVVEERYGRNVTALRRQIPLALRPSSEDEVARVVSLANRHRIALYPFSTGRNWGLGSKLPVVDGCVVVDLSRMNRIVEVDEAFAYAILEPGVTQGQLAQYLADHHPSLTFNFTGSFAHTSIVGNVLERGDGGYARVDDLLGVRGILGNGRVFRAGGFWDAVGTGRPSHHMRFAAGPDLAGMFSQSNFGITTRMAFRLIPRPERRYLVWGTAPDERLESLVDAFHHLGSQGVIRPGSVNIGYANRFVQAAPTMQDGSSALDEPDWNFYVLVTGTRRTADAAVEELKDAVAPICTSVAAYLVAPGADPYTELPEFLRPIAKPLFDFPDDDSIKLIYKLTATPFPSDPRDLDVDRTPFGMKCYIPVIPPRGSFARRAAAIVTSVKRDLDLNVKFSLFGDGRGLITIHFRSDDPEQVRAAERCELELWAAMIDAGFPPYRASIDQMQRLVQLRPDMLELVTQLKSVLDPNGVIAPGRYGPR